MGLRTGDAAFMCAMVHGSEATRRALDGPRYRHMARDFRCICAARPYLNHVVVARDVGARAFAISVDQLLARVRDGELTEARQKIMAFAYVMTGAAFSQIGRFFDRDHSAVHYACDKYADAVRAEVDG